MAKKVLKRAINSFKSRLSSRGLGGVLLLLFVGSSSSYSHLMLLTTKREMELVVGGG
ncbi:hypothetical protein [Helicobacter pylori]|uniref:hypothetical protein n=1 Tax=Helicobacter pylori TaxID=210 RepID=UPI0018831D7F|nr:hypothetical protein [Helicobacter pylori]